MNFMKNYAKIIDYLKDINVCYLVLNILLIIVLMMQLKRMGIKSSKRRIICLLALFISGFLFPYVNGIVQGIFGLKYLSVRIYLLLIVIVQVIALITYNKTVKLFYAIMNYTFYILMMIIFVTNFIIILGNRIEYFYWMDISNVVILMDLSFILFMIYGIFFSIVYFGYYLVLDKKKGTSKENDRKENDTMLTDEALLCVLDKENFMIQGVNCGIIFEDSHSENIIKNYHILSKNIDAKMVNGYTLKENLLLRSICMKLKVRDLGDIDLYNLNILNKLSVEEYRFLKSIKNNM